MKNKEIFKDILPDGKYTTWMDKNNKITFQIINGNVNKNVEMYKKKYDFKYIMKDGKKNGSYFKINKKSKKRISEHVFHKDNLLNKKM